MVSRKLKRERRGRTNSALDTMLHLVSLLASLAVSTTQTFLSWGVPTSRKYTSRPRAVSNSSSSTAMLFLFLRAQFTLLLPCLINPFHQSIMQCHCICCVIECLTSTRMYCASSQIQTSDCDSLHHVISQRKTRLSKLHRPLHPLPLVPCFLTSTQPHVTTSQREHLDTYQSLLFPFDTTKPAPASATLPSRPSRLRRTFSLSHHTSNKLNK